MPQRVLKIIITAVLLIGFFMLAPQKSLAHAVPELSNPAPNSILEESPTKISIFFNEPIVPALSRIELLSQSGQKIDTGALEMLDGEGLVVGVTVPPLANGAYLVSWQVLSTVDGHTTSGSFSFGVGVAALAAGGNDVTVTAQISPVSAAARSMILMAITLLLGLAVFQLLIWNGLQKRQPSVSGIAAQLDRFVQWTGWVGLLLLLIACGLIFWEQNSNYQLLQADNFTIWRNTRYGMVWQIRLGLALLIGIQLVLLSKLKDWWLWISVLAVAAMLALTNGLVSHSAALIDGSELAIVIDWLHILAAGSWVGGLMPLAVLFWLTRTLPAKKRTPIYLEMLLTFSTLAAIATGVLLLSGFYLAGKHIGGWIPLIGTAYGLILLAKIALALPAFGIAFYNLWFVKPQLQSGAANRVLVGDRLRKLAIAEVCITLLIIPAAGILTDVQRAIDAPLLSGAAGEMRSVLQVENVEVSLEIEPALVGQNSFIVRLQDEQGEPISDASEVVLRFVFLGRSIGASTGSAEPLGNGRYLLEGSFISLVGDWQVETVVRRPGEFDLFAPFRLEAGVNGNIHPLDEGSKWVEEAAKFMTIAGGGGTGLLLILFALGWAVIAYRFVDQLPVYYILMGMSVALIVVGADQMTRFFTDDFTPTKFLTNPILPDAASIAAGEQLYTDNCVACHGEEGRADGPLALSLDYQPADFTDGHTETHPDGDLFYWIREGVEGKPMPAFGEQFEDEQIWHLINYIRRLSSLPPTAAGGE